MNSLVRKWRNFNNRRKFTKVGRKTRLDGWNIEVDGDVELGSYCHIRSHCIFRTRLNGKIVFKDRSGCSWYTIIESGNLVEIGEGTGLAEGVVIRDGTHLIYGTKEYWRFTPFILKQTIIGPYAWIGSRAYICEGVMIGEGAVVGANSVVTKNIPPYEIWGGIPARKISHRVDDAPPEKLAEAKELLEKYGMRHDRWKDAID